MSRSARQSKILDVLSRRSIHTQEELVDALKGEGYDVTQATVSRDIKELALVKIPDGDGTYKYAVQRSAAALSAKQLTVLRESVISVSVAENLVVVKTIEDSAPAVSGSIEQLGLQGVLGVIADRRTVLIVASSAREAALAADRINALA